ncbi:MAG: effector-binding domain-containing protein [Candidatus Endobugula sp.]|jgi:effector-binding domain-containing protein
MSKKWVIILSVMLIFLAGFAMIGPVMSNVEQPKYQLISTQQNIEVREYEPMIIAEVQVNGKREEAISQGFRLLADYIFGNNQAQEKISLSTSVPQQANQKSNQKIAMTAPVKQQAFDGAWTISFVMPSEYSMETLPRPNNQVVSLKKVPSKRYVVIRFSGMSSNSNITQHEKELAQYLFKQQIPVVAPPTYAFYNPPMTLPLLRRNEIMLEIE